jgi:CheY-like chemotaxis protein
LHTQKILIADDEASVRLLIEATLASATCRVLPAENGLVALEMARRELPDLIILDWLMPGRTGPEVVEQLRSDPRTAEIPIVLLTGMSQEQDRLKALGAGVFAYVVKPFSPLKLLQLVQQLLNKRSDDDKQRRGKATATSGRQIA